MRGGEGRRAVPGRIVRRAPPGTGTEVTPMESIALTIVLLYLVKRLTE